MPRATGRNAQETSQAPYTDVVACAPVSMDYSRYSVRSAHWFLARVVQGLIQTAGLGKDDIDGLCVSSFQLTPDTAVGLTQHLGVSPRWLDHIPMGGASGVVALRRAARAVQCGDAEVVACIAGDTNHVDTFRKMLGSFSQYAQDGVYPYGSGGPNASFAFLTAHYMRTTGARREDFGKLCIAQRDNALANPQALFQKPLTIDEYLHARVISTPLRLFDCVMPCAGGEGFLVMRRQRAEALGLQSVRILSSIERHNAWPDDAIQMRGGWAMDRDALYAGAGRKPEDIDFLCTYDDYPVINALQFEGLGFCGAGQGAEFIREHDFRWNGSFPLNPSGGQLSVGQAGAAGGYLGLVEAIRQLSGQGIGHQVPNARLGLVSGFGMINYDRGLCSAAALLAHSDG